MSGRKNRRVAFYGVCEMRAKRGLVTNGLIPVAEADTVASIITACTSDLIEIGVKAALYYLTPAFHSQVSKKTFVAHFGFADEHIREYLDPAIFENDPIPDYVMDTGRAMSWEQALASVKLPELQVKFTRKMVKSGIGNGMCMPLFGSNGRDSFCVVVPTDENKLGDLIFVKQAINICQFAHRKICLVLIRDDQEKFTLSKRENEVIYWIARGKSNYEISIILGISAGTVDTYIRRLYSKLGVNDRIGAVVAGMSKGLVHI